MVGSELIKRKISPKNGALANPLKSGNVNSKILEKIEQLSREGGVFGRRSETPFRLDLTPLNSRIIMIGQCWKNRTEVLSGRNNIEEMSIYLKKKYDKRYSILRLTEWGNEYFENVQKVDSISYSISKVFDICKSISGWLSLDPEHVMVIERRGNTEKLMFLVFCVVKFLGYSDHLQGVAKYPSSFQYGKREAHTLGRYLKLFDRICAKDKTRSFDHEKNELSPFKTLLHQIIITSIPMFDSSGRCNPVFKVFRDGKEVFSLMSEDKGLIMDENYIIVNFDDLEVFGDSLISMYNQNTSELEPAFDLYLNTFDYRQGLYRFNRFDLDYPFPKEVVNKRFRPDFMVDVVFFEDEEVKVKIPYTLEGSFIGNLRLLGEHLYNKPDLFKLKKLIDDGYNRVCSKVLLQLGYNVEECKEYIGKLLQRGFKDLITVKAGQLDTSRVIERALFEPKTDFNKGVLIEPTMSKLIDTSLPEQ
jgi:hypothetical protein